MLTPGKAMQLAIEAAGLSDFGARGFEDGLERSLAAFATLPLTPDARAAAEAKTVADLANRLRIEQYCRDHPQVASQPVSGPVLVCGLPRTGTTATVAMMALDPRFRFLRAWEANQPVPPPRAGHDGDDPRAVAARAAAASYGNQSQHLFDPDGPEEDIAMLAGLDMHAYHGAYPMPDDFVQWWMEKDFRPFYAFHRRLLQLLHSERPPHLWLLKAPTHLFKLEAFAAEYPEARFIMTHRDPAKVIASDASLRWRLHGERCEMGGQDKRDYGPRLLAFWSEGMRRAMQARERIGEDRFIDVFNTDVAADPLGTFERVYDRLGYTLDDGLRASIAAYNSRNAMGAHGEHRYTPEEYGLTRDAIRSTFRDYCERFDL
jgi:hypothetical protein